MRRLLPLVLLLAALAPAGASAAGAGLAPGQTGNGRQLDPVGRLTTLGAFPTGGALSPDGRFYWAVDAGRGPNAVRIVDVGTGAVAQTIALPGGYVGITFAADGRRAYVSGQPGDGPVPAGLKGPGGEVVHVFDVDPRTGKATELEPIAIPGTRDGAAANDGLPPSTGVNAWPEGMDITADGRFLVVALGQADQAAIVELTSRAVTLADVGRYPYGVVTDPRRSRAYVTNERDGSVSVLDVPSGKLVKTIFVGNTRNDYAHPEGLVADPLRDRLYVAVTDRDLVAVIDTAGLRLERYVDVGRKDAQVGTAPVSPTVSPDGGTLYVANAGEDAVVAVALTDRPTTAQGATPRTIAGARSVAQIGRYRAALARARRVRDRSGAARARRTFAARLATLRKGFLRGYPRKLCAGPSPAQDRAYGAAVLRAYATRDAALRRAATRPTAAGRARARRAARAAFTRTTTAARKRLPLRAACPRPGFLRGLRAFETIGRLPTAAYTTDVEVTPDGKRLVWLAAKGVGTGPNNLGVPNIDRLVVGRAGVLDQPSDRAMAALTARADRAVVPTNAAPPPLGTPVQSPSGGASTKIKHVFFVVRENRTYDQVFGSEPRGTGDPRLQLFDDNGVPGPTGGVTPNAHALARRFSLLDDVFANTEESTQGHKVAAGGYVNDYTVRKAQTGRGKKGDPDIFGIGTPPNAFVFDQAVRQGTTFRVYGEGGASNTPFGNDGRDTYDGVQRNTDPVYPNQLFGTCRSPALSNLPPGTPNSVRCTADAGTVGATTSAPAANSRIRAFQAQFNAQVAAGSVPQFNYFSLFNDHTDGTTPGAYTPKADMADNDLALGQLVELVSQSPIWAESAIIVQEDDSQDGMDSVDAHRIPAFVISPWAKRGAVISTRYDQYSILRTASLILGLKPLSLNDALATPMYDAFISGSEQPDVEGTRYRAIQPEQSLTEVNGPGAPNARLSLALPFDKADAVPQSLSDRIIWQSVFGAGATVPRPGPGASRTERLRGTEALRLFRAGKDVREYLLEGAGRAEDDDG